MDNTERVFDLRPVTFLYKTASENGPIQYGLIAEEVEEIFPELVVRDINDEPHGIKYEFLSSILLNELQKMRLTLEDYENRLTTLENQ